MEGARLLWKVGWGRQESIFLWSQAIQEPGLRDWYVQDQVFGSQEERWGLSEITADARLQSSLSCGSQPSSMGQGLHKGISGETPAFYSLK